MSAFTTQDGARSNKNLKLYAEAASSVAKEAGLPYVDLFHKMQVWLAESMRTCGTASSACLTL